MTRLQRIAAAADYLERARKVLAPLVDRATHDNADEYMVAIGLTRAAGRLDALLLEAALNDTIDRALDATSTTSIDCAP